MSEGRITFDRTDEEKEASARKLNAEAAAAEAEAAKTLLRVEMETLNLEKREIELGKARELEQVRLAKDFHKRVLRFLSQVTSSSARAAAEELVGWHRIDPGCDIHIIFDSPGGSIIDGFHLFDTILQLREKGHYVTTYSLGMAASMAGILLQAGDKRVMSPQAALLIHEASFAAMGSYGKVEDQMEFIKKLQDRILDIFAERSEMTKDEIEDKWHRKDWWMLAEEAKELGFIDEVGFPEV